MNFFTTYLWSGGNQSCQVPPQLFKIIHCRRLFPILNPLRLWGMFWLSCQPVLNSEMSGMKLHKAYPSWYRSLCGRILVICLLLKSRQIQSFSDSKRIMMLWLLNTYLLFISFRWQPLVVWFMMFVAFSRAFLVAILPVFLPSSVHCARPVPATGRTREDTASGRSERLVGEYQRICSRCCSLCSLKCNLNNNVVS
jgi:hypothetical protein